MACQQPFGERGHPRWASNRSSHRTDGARAGEDRKLANFTFNHRAYHWVLIGLLFVAVAGLAGCGNVAIYDEPSQPLFVADCGADTVRPVEESVIINWSGGVTPIYPHQAFEAFDPSAFPLDVGGTLADAEDLFKQEVVAQVNRIFCDGAVPALRVVNDNDAADLNGVDATTVYLTQSVSPVSDHQIGEGEFDVCNEQHDNVAVVFGERVRQMAFVYSFDEWVRIFANIAAHEIGHTLGFAHISRDVYDPGERPLYVELMLDGHTMSELRQEQRFVVDQTNCPDSRSRLRRLDDYPIVTCGILD